VNIDRFIHENRPLWQRLDLLTTRATGNPGRLTTSELEELVTSYERVNTHLSTARTHLRNPQLVAMLSELTARAGAVVYGTRPRSWRVPLRFVTDTFPAAVWHVRHFVLIATLLFLVPAIAVGSWLASSEEALDLAAPPALREEYVERDFEEYYSSKPSAQFASEVSTNNIRVGITAFAGGILLCIPTVLVLLANGMNLGGAAGAFGAAAEMPRFFGLILPHGLLELTAVFVAGAAGLRLGWTLIDPGDRKRGEALAEEGRRAVVIVMGLVGVFLIAGLIEGFVTGSPLPTWIRVGIGVVAELAFLLYVALRGRQVAARGLTGALGEQRSAGWTAVTDDRST
jgi:uncharacterized membrane protein SpoIIM required for sporulation